MMAGQTRHYGGASACGVISHLNDPLGDLNRLITGGGAISPHPIWTVPGTRHPRGRTLSKSKRGSCFTVAAQRTPRMSI